VIRGAVVLAAALALIAPATAAASSKPGVSVSAESNRTFNSVIVNAKIDPNNAETTYFIRWGLTKLYGSETPHQSAGSGGAPRAVSIGLTGLAPDTRYHYRVIAVNQDGITRSADRSFKTAKQPLGVTLAASETSVDPNAPVVLTGQLTGTNNANRDVRIEASQWPYTTGFAQIGNKIVTDSLGNFTFNVLNVPFNTQFRVALAQRPEVVSPVVVVLVPMAVKTDIRTVKTFRHSKKVRFKGTVTPAPVTPLLVVQKKRDGVWTTIATAGKWTASATGLTFKKKVRIGKSGQFRLVAQDSAGKYAAGAGRVLSIKAPR
jgi:hypothetical protein